MIKFDLPEFLLGNQFMKGSGEYNILHLTMMKMILLIYLVSL